MTISWGRKFVDFRVQVKKRSAVIFGNCADNLVTRVRKRDCHPNKQAKMRYYGN